MDDGFGTADMIPTIMISENDGKKLINFISNMKLNDENYPILVIYFEVQKAEKA